MLCHNVPGIIFDVSSCGFVCVCGCVSVLSVNHKGGDYSFKVNSQKCVYYGKSPNSQRIYNLGYSILSVII